MPKKRIKDSITIAKKIENAERDLKRYQNYALLLLGASISFTVGLLVIQYVYLTSLRSVYVYSMTGLMMGNFVLAFLGFNAIFYSDQARLSVFRTWSIVFFILVLLLAVVQLSIGLIDSTEDIALLRGLIGSFILIIIIIATLQLYIITKIINSLRSEGQKSGLRTAAYDRQAYDSHLEKSLSVAEGEFD